MKHLEYINWAEIKKTPEQELEVHEALVKIEKDYELAKKKLNKKFIQIYEKEDRFHDMGLVTFRMYPDKKRKDCILNIEIELKYSNNYKPSYKLTFKEVLDFSYRHVQQVMERWARMPLMKSFGTWMYSEIYIEDNYIACNIALAGDGEINIVCKNVEAERV